VHARSHIHIYEDLGSDNTALFAGRAQETVVTKSTGDVISGVRRLLMNNTLIIKKINAFKISVRLNYVRTTKSKSGMPDQLISGS
jgi:hypothetical protein